MFDKLEDLRIRLDEILNEKICSFVMRRLWVSFRNRTW